MTRRVALVVLASGVVAVISGCGGGGQTSAPRQVQFVATEPGTVLDALEGAGYQAGLKWNKDYQANEVVAITQSGQSIIDRDLNFLVGTDVPGAAAERVIIRPGDQITWRYGKERKS